MWSRVPRRLHVSICSYYLSAFTRLICTVLLGLLRAAALAQYARAMWYGPLPSLIMTGYLLPHQQDLRDTWIV
jgi:hypothetical protein